MPTDRAENNFLDRAAGDGHARVRYPINTYRDRSSISQSSEGSKSITQFLLARSLLATKSGYNIPGKSIERSVQILYAATFHRIDVTDADDAR